MNDYLDHVMREGNTMSQESRRLKLYSNNPNTGRFLYLPSLWSEGVFDHPKRGYLLYGPPGTGKSGMIASMANLLNYDVYDLELTAVADNSELRRLLQDTTDKSIIVIEDIDCSLNLTGKRKKQQKEDEVESDKDDESDDDKEKEASNDKKSNVTLSGLLNFIDGLWSASGKERITVFTTNHVKKCHCCFEGFKTLAKNYLDLDSHDLFEPIGSLIREVEMTPADVAEHLMPKGMNKNSQGD
ncbi:hypothetical protein MKW98_007440 [Papaver atlanticum]|uniref:AAA+ ATPase domain-containing protein n=1 Tax=Papaver atlanticum TaxID=357466 RepID=A0AAD4SB60_9MAGN|nr:hypothetical protein MKW98_007440 [Papaver atlanticum]